MFEVVNSQDLVLQEVVTLQAIQLPLLERLGYSFPCSPLIPTTMTVRYQHIEYQEVTACFIWVQISWASPHWDRQWLSSLVGRQHLQLRISSSYPADTEKLRLGPWVGMKPYLPDDFSPVAVAWNSLTF